MVTHKKRVFFIICLLLSIGISFGYFSRYPDLNHKALMAEKATVADTIAMWPILKIKAYDPTWKKIAYTTINWCNDNKKGMAFGLIIASLLAAMMNYLRFRPSSSPLRNTFYGFILGTPLGICVNCAAPVFKGMLQSRRIEMALALMFSSPTLNVVVVTMAFTLLPLYMAVTKLVFNLVVIFTIVPFMAKYLAHWPVKDIAKLEALTQAGEVRSDEPVLESWWQALSGFVRDFFRQFGPLCVRTVPLMLLAGFLGAALSHTLPLDVLRGAHGPIPFILAASVGLILPVPMAFDVVLTNALYTAGLPSSIAMVLLLSLGVFSLYSFFIVWQSASQRWALSLAALLLILIVPLGLMAPQLHETFYMAPNIKTYRELTEASRSQVKDPLASTPSLAAKAIPLATSAPVWTAEDPITQGQLQATPYRFFPAKKGATQFAFHEGQELGLVQGFQYTVRDYPDPFWVGRGTAAGDFDRDGWPDLAFGSDQGVLLYHNIGGTFEKMPDVSAELKDKRVFAVAFVDLNNDGWLDLFVSTFMHGNHFLLNLGGTFEKDLRPIPNGNGVLTVAPAFADIDRDGFLDVFNGNMALGIATGFRAYGEGRSNGISYSNRLNFTYEPTMGKDGETMASILSDINGDGYIDLYQNNDFIVPDQLSFGGPGKSWQHLSGKSVEQFATPFFSMSVDTGDIDNDLRLDLLVTGTIAAKQDLGDQTIDGMKPEAYKKAKDSLSYCDKIKNPSYRESCIRNRKSDHFVPFNRLKSLNVSDCQKLEGETERDDCLLSMMWMIVTNNDDGVACSERYSFDPKIMQVCKLMRAAGPYFEVKQFEGEAPQIDRAVIYKSTSDGGLTRVPAEDFEHPGGWTWSSKFADIDNDGWLDIINAEGAVRKGEWGFNVYMHNEGDGKFVQKQFSSGFQNDFNLFSAVLIDYDRDGDLDVIGNGSEGPIQIYENQSPTANNSIAFSLKLPKGNQLGVGAKILIRDNKGRRQLREIKASGGYMSFDAPEAYFGLADADVIDELTVVSPGGKKQSFAVSLEAGALYQIDLSASAP